MKASTMKYGVLMTLVWLTGLIIFLVPFHAFLTVWLAKYVGHYTALRLWKEALLAIAAVCALYLLLTDHKVRTYTLNRRLVWVIAGYGMVQLVSGFLAYQGDRVTLKALAYGLLVNLRFLAFFLITWAVAVRTGRLKNLWQRAVVWPLVGVVIFGLLQIFVLPDDFLKHFGYSEQTIPAFETINSNRNYVRIASTLRGPNPLGAYLLIPISVLSVLLVRGQRKWGNILLLLGSAILLLFSFSRSAWLGAFVSLLLILSLEVRSPKSAQWLLLTGCLLAVGGGLAFLGLRHNPRFQNIIFHTEQRSTISIDSNEARASSLHRGLKDLVSEPLGRGPGTAGPASVYNGGRVRLAENYFLQIGQETGWPGLLLFSLINGATGYVLWLRRRDPLALMLLAALAGITVVNILSHAWTDDTLAYIWWGLAGVAVGMPMTRPLRDSNVED